MNVNKEKKRNENKGRLWFLNERQKNINKVKRKRLKIQNKSVFF